MESEREGGRASPASPAHCKLHTSGPHVCLVLNLAGRRQREGETGLHTAEERVGGVRGCGGVGRQPGHRSPPGKVRGSGRRGALFVIGKADRRASREWQSSGQRRPHEASRQQLYLPDSSVRGGVHPQQRGADRKQRKDSWPDRERETDGKTDRGAAMVSAGVSPLRLAVGGRGGGPSSDRSHFTPRRKEQRTHTAAAAAAAAVRF